MKRNRISALLVVGFLLSSSVFSQETSKQVATKIANTMKSTLSLTGQQQQAIYNVNMQLSNMKTDVRRQYVNPDSLQVRTQQVEKMRDSLYKIILTGPQYLFYREQKNTLINNN